MNSQKTDRRYLAWDTATPTGVLAAFEIQSGKKKLVAEWTLSLETSKHSERLLWTIDVILQSSGWSLESLDGLVIGVGPGSFTGLRIGITCARMLSMQLNIPIIPISSLALLARPAAVAAVDSPKALVMACTDATKGEWFTLMGSAKMVKECVIQPEEPHAGAWGRGVKERTLTPDDFFAEAKAYLKKAGAGTPWLAVGQSVERYESLFKALPSKSRIIPADYFIHQPQARILVQLGWEAIQQGIERNSLQVFPHYLRASDAEVKLKKGLLKQAPGIA